MTRWLMLQRAIYLLRRGRRLREAYERDFAAVQRIVDRLYPGSAANQGAGAHPMVSARGAGIHTPFSDQA